MGARPVAAFLSLGLPRDLVQNPQARGAVVLARPLPRRLSRPRPGPQNPAGRRRPRRIPRPPRRHRPHRLGPARQSPAPLRRPPRRPALRHRQLSAAPLRASPTSPNSPPQSNALAPARTWSLHASPPGSKALLARTFTLSLASLRAFGSRGIPLASAAIDLSDGLSTDLAHLCHESGVAAEVDAPALPIHPAATPAQALHGGEEYELLFTAPPAARVPASIEGVPVTRIGRIVAVRRATPLVVLVTERGAQPLAPRGWEHFS